MQVVAELPRQRFSALDACRGLCAVAVMLFHLDALTHFYAWPVVRNGYVAVDFFFVLSGFVIASAYGRKLDSANALGRFAVRRFGRLYPLHAAVLLLYVVVQAATWFAGQPAFSDNYSLPSLLANVLLVQGFGSYHETWNYPAWSISVELWTNLAFGLYVWWLGGRSALLSAALLAASAAYVIFHDQIPFPWSDEAADALLDVAQSVFGFILGTFAFAQYERARRAAWKPNALVEVIAVGLIALPFSYASALPGIAIPLIFGVAVLAFAFEAGPISALLRRPACTGLGTISYSVYLTHSLYLMALEAAVLWLGQHLGLPPTVQVNGNDLLALGGPWAMDVAALACVATALVGSTLTYRFIEEPARRFFNRLSGGRGARTDPLPASRAIVEIPIT